MNIKIKKCLYIKLSDLGGVVDEFMKDNPHNNGWAYIWNIIDPDESAYPEVEQQLLSMGLKIGDEILIHNIW